MTTETMRQILAVLEGIDDLPDFDEVDRQKNLRIIQRTVKRLSASGFFRQVLVGLPYWKQQGHWVLTFKIPTVATEEIKAAGLANTILSLRVFLVHSNQQNEVDIKLSWSSVPYNISPSQYVDLVRDLSVKCAIRSINQWLVSSIPENIDDQGTLTDENITDVSWYGNRDLLPKQVESVLVGKLSMLFPILDTARDRNEFDQLLDKILESVV